MSCLLSFALLAGIASAINLNVSATGGNASSPLTYGLMFEDINHSGDGGIYAELIQNRAFQGSLEYPSTLTPWVSIGDAILTLQNTSVPLSKSLPTSINVASNSTNGTIGLLNPGWWGIDVKPQKYTGSFWALGSYKGKFTVKLQSDLTDEVFASLDIPSSATPEKWTEHKFELEPRIAAPNSNNTFVLEFDSKAGSLNFNLISLFPPTYNNRPNGNRPDLMEALKDLGGSFYRIPGGNNIEGDAYHHPWLWNETIGPLTERPGRPGTWGYQNTDGLGLVEYLNWCTDISVTPILAVWSGMYLGNEVDHILTASELEPWVQYALDELEFILGPSHSTHGALRAQLGHPEPWELKYVEIGNEDDLYDNGAETYSAYRFSMFYEAISASYPDLILISSTGDYTAVGGSNTSNPSATDYHTYSRPDYFVSQFGHFDNASREYKSLIGEYACVQGNVYNQVVGVDWDAPKLPWNPWVGSVSEAIFSLGAERNGDAIIGMSYAPGFQNLNSYEWTPNLIAFTADPSQTIKSTSHHVIELLSNNRYNATVPVTTDSDYGPAYWVAGVSEPGHYTFKAAIYNSTSTVPFSISFEGLSEGVKGTLSVLNAPDGLSSNTLENGVVSDVVRKTVTTLAAGSGGVFQFELDNYDVAVLTT
ncbi:Alpha-L-arabinofuranosidase A [Lachnellula hyalina]|uniref:non-reducing end alpha-L-arabinofuranosidase n=1 Tax=Lachnellula hyalina TaxID=1316788 RepID=A0A8H8U020_9HELO|nr:Alpha-L-arabinofuranosidase A [Lachnellula hyalina]TVY25586.1 Alpha-L-arabinofuranosidase A [Lachnellula hyalina]